MKIITHIKLIGFIAVFCFSVNIPATFAMSSEDFISAFHANGLEPAVATALEEGMNLEDLMTAALSIEGMNPTPLLIALFRNGGASSNDIIDAAYSQGISAAIIVSAARQGTRSKENRSMFQQHRKTFKPDPPRPVIRSDTDQPSPTLNADQQNFIAVVQKHGLPEAISSALDKDMNLNDLILAALSIEGMKQEAVLVALLNEGSISRKDIIDTAYEQGISAAVIVSIARQTMQTIDRELLNSEPQEDTFQPMSPSAVVMPVAGLIGGNRYVVPQPYTSPSR